MSSSSAASSDNDSDREECSDIARLGECEVCGANPAKYTCPKCEVKTCSLNCVIVHKKELDCDGVRDRTKFIRMKDFTDNDLLSDYRLLEECARFVYGVKRDEKKRYTRIDSMLPFRLMKLKIAANKRGVALQFLAQNFSRHKKNTTQYLPKQNVINWRIEWVFPNVENEPLKFVDEHCADNKRLSEHLDKYLNPNAMPFEGSKALAYYKSAGFSGVKVLLRAEKVRGSSRKFFELDCTETLAENLCGKVIVEFPIVFVVMKDHAYNFEIVTPEDEFDYEKVDTDKTTQNGENIDQATNGDVEPCNKNIPDTEEIKTNNSEMHASPNGQFRNNEQQNRFRGSYRGRGNSNHRQNHRNGHQRFQNGSHNRWQNQNTQSTSNSEANCDNTQNEQGQASQNGQEMYYSPNQTKPWNNRKRPQLLTQVILQKKQKEIENEIKEAKKKRPKNLLFTTGYSSEESLSDSEDEKKDEMTIGK